MTIDELNALPADQAATALRACADVDAWVDRLVDRRPYDDVEDLYAQAVEAAAEWSDAEVDAALADHPRIGERTTRPLSVGEQAGMATAGEELQERMRAGNAAYEERFGRIYLVRAAGRSAEELLAILEQRLGNAPEDEVLETKRQLAEIAVLRLRGLVER
jgi:2-oxo-4-hydroxy-4-carboxy-5-ureidoimidazoline decarboxylase